MTLLCTTTEPGGERHARRLELRHGVTPTALGVAVLERDPFAGSLQRTGTRVWLPLHAVVAEIETAELAAELWSGRRIA